PGDRTSRRCWRGRGESRPHRLAAQTAVGRVDFTGRFAGRAVGHGFLDSVHVGRFEPATQDHPYSHSGGDEHPGTAPSEILDVLNDPVDSVLFQMVRQAVETPGAV